MFLHETICSWLEGQRGRSSLSLGALVPRISPEDTSQEKQPSPKFEDLTDAWRQTKQGESMLESPGRLQDPWEEDQEGGLAGEPALSRKTEPPQLPQARLASRWRGRCPRLGPHTGRATLCLLTQQCVCRQSPSLLTKWIWSGSCSSIENISFASAQIPPSGSATIADAIGKNTPTLQDGFLDLMPIPTELLETPDRLL